MIKSMTGFGRCEVMENDRKFTVEMKSVNHRYLDVNIKMPKKFAFFESSIRALLKEYIQRGKVDIFISYEDFSKEEFSIRYNEATAATYLNYLRQMAETFGLDDDIRVSTLSRYPEVFTMEEQTLDEKELWEILERALRGACEQFVETRIEEGKRLKADLIEKLDKMETYVDFIEERYPKILEEYREKIFTKVSELLENHQVDEARIASEVVIFADKICVDEEMVRLRSHIKGTKEALEAGNEVGRKLDFIAQEMNREANTTLSKTTDIEISNIGIELKTDIEKVREQIQNIE